MTKEDQKLQVQAVQSMFINGHVKKMKDIEKLYPTMIAKSININHSRYIQRLYKPDLFTVKQIRDLAALIDVNPLVIINIILKQPRSATKATKS